MATRIAEVHRDKVQYTHDNMLAGLSAELKLYLGRGGKFKDLSKQCGNTPRQQTISRIAYGETRFPRWQTVVILFIALGFNITATRG